MQSGEVAYTRAGSFHLNREGNIVTADGDLIDPRFTIPADAQSISIGSDGTVSYSQPGQTATQLAGQIQLANFPNPAGLNSLGRNLFAPTDASGDAQIGNPGGRKAWAPFSRVTSSSPMSALSRSSSISSSANARTKQIRKWSRLPTKCISKPIM